MTLNEITTQLAARMDRELDEPFKMMLGDLVNVWRSRLIRNSVDKDSKERRYFKQVIYLEMQTANEVTCQVPYTQCKVAITKANVPKPLRANGILFDYVGAIDGMNPFKEGSAGMIGIMTAGKYSSKILQYTYENDKIKVYGNPLLPWVRIDDVFDDPEAASKLSSCSTTATCNFWDEPYPASGDIIQLIMQSIMSVDFTPKTIPEDKQTPVVAEP